MAALYFALPLAIMGCVIAFLTYRFSVAKLAADTASTRTASGDEIEQLKRRIATLEQLLTDDDRKLASEIDRLRRDEGYRPEA